MMKGRPALFKGLLDEFNGSTVARWFVMAGFAMDDVAGLVIPELVKPQIDDVQFLLLICGGLIYGLEFLLK